ncbi:MAG: prepilin-type N-terminal cleavage/methylation domain-containing protein [Planctomycetota bacterium]|nr:prepilin-type N-terminal cleavage/methylation domain-containing protein [Planctomycetota bacterium]
MTGRAASHRQAGFTMIELMASIVLFSIVILVALQSSLVAGRVTASLVSTSELDLQAHRVVDQIAEELLQARAETLTPDAMAPYGSSVLTYERAEATTGGGVVWTTTRRIEFVQSASDALDGVDNDGNGLVDDGEIWLVTDAGLPGERRALLARHVAGFLAGEQENALDDNANGLTDERGLSFELRDGALHVRVSLQAVDPKGGYQTHTAETAIRMRN